MASETKDDAPPTARERFRVADRERAELEAEMTALLAALGPAGMHGPLVDADGFPRADVDVMEVRTNRQRIIMRRNDLAAKMRELDALVHAVHAEARPATGGEGGGASAVAAAPPSGSASAGAGAGPGAAVANASDAVPPPPTHAAPAAGAGVAASAVSATPPVAMARVKSVAAGSPAAEAGLQPGDTVVEFGALSATATPKPDLSAIAGVVGRSVGSSVRVVVARRASGGWAQVELSLTPHAWAGAGVVGFHIVAAD